MKTTCAPLAVRNPLGISAMLNRTKTLTFRGTWKIRIGTVCYHCDKAASGFRTCSGCGLVICDSCAQRRAGDVFNTDCPMERIERPGLNGLPEPFETPRQK